MNQKVLPLPRFAFHANVAAMTAHDLLGDIKTQAGSFRPVLGNLKKLFKDSLLVFLWNSFAGVRHGEAHRAVGDARTQGHRTLALGVAQRVADEIGKYMADALVIRQHFDFRNRGSALRRTPFASASALNCSTALSASTPMGVGNG